MSKTAEDLHNFIHGPVESVLSIQHAVRNAMELLETHTHYDPLAVKNGLEKWIEDYATSRAESAVREYRERQWFRPDQRPENDDKGAPEISEIKSNTATSTPESHKTQESHKERYKIGYRDGYNEGWNNLIDNIIKDLSKYQLPDSEDSRWTLSGIEKELEKIRK